VSIKNSANSAGPRVWTVAELGAFYTAHRTELLAHANRVLKDSNKAEEITQDALIKFILAAPELESTDHAISYLHRTIENLCIDLFRSEGRRPNLVVLDDASAEIEATWAVDGDHSAAMTAAEDAAIIRQAISLLSPAERAALVMWEIEGRSTEEIAAELGIKPATVRHTVSRARLSLRRILTEVVLDQERGLTAMDMLSTSYKKAAELAKKSTTAALSLLLVVTAFLGFNSMTGNEAITNGTSKIASVIPGAPSSPSSPSSPANPGAEQNGATDLPSADSDNATVTSVATDIDTFFKGMAVVQQGIMNLRSVATNIGWAGLDSNGAPIGISTNNGAYTQVDRDSVKITTLGAGDFVLTSSTNGLDTYLVQTIEIVDGQSVLSLAPLFAQGSTNVSPEILDYSSQETRLEDGSRLISAWVIIDQSESPLPLPSQINVKLKVTADGSQVISAAAQYLYTPTTDQARA
jgi:RNA polymerase sigma factor (sigma-70 family)